MFEINEHRKNRKRTNLRFKATNVFRPIIEHSNMMWRACIAPPQKPPSYSVSNSYAKTNIIRRTVSIGIITREIELNSHIISPCRCEYLKTFVSKQTLFIVSKHSCQKQILVKRYTLFEKAVFVICPLSSFFLKKHTSRTWKYLNRQIIKGYVN